MAFTLNKVVPWGRSYEEYVAMFALQDNDLRSKILSCGDGPAGFNSTLTKRGGKVVSVDPIYQFSARQIEDRIEETYAEVIQQMRKNEKDYVWTSIASVEELARIRMSAMQNFLADYESGKLQGRYLAGELPSLPCEDKEFDLALSSHFLFLYSNHFSLEFHHRSVAEMCRVAREIRIFPLLDLGGSPSPYVEPVVERFDGSGSRVSIETVPYEFQRGGDKMLRITTI